MMKLRIIAWFVLINFVTVTLFPTLTFALTSGPTSPEFSSFEPIETTDMVNLNTGDFTYSIPLLEVPGPEGGYPMALSYHAGISPEEEASWVGLGWNLNPGAISRMVNGFPDDMNRSSNLIHDQWNGGETSTYSLTVGYGSSYIGAGVGLTYATDTYKGVGLGVELSVGLKVSSYASVGITMGAGPYDESHAGIGLSLHTAGSGANAALYLGIMASSEQEGITAVGGVGVGVTGASKGNPTVSLLGASLSSNGTQSSFSGSVGGISGSSSNANAGNVNVLSSGWNWDIFNYYGIYASIGTSHTRYFLDQIDQTPVYGSLYAANIGTDYANVSFDCYAIPEAIHSYNSNPDYSLGGSVPSYDHYMVSGQGIGGSIQPYIYEPGALFRKGSASFSYGSGFSKFNNPVGFRFVYDFSNSFTRNNTDQVYNTINDFVTNITANVGVENKPYDASTFLDFNKSTGQLAGSKHVEWFTNDQIDAYATSVASGSYNASSNGLKGFIPSIDQRPAYLQLTDEYGQDAHDNIGGFLVTNESGVSYHYSIPVYNFNDVTKYSSNFNGDYSRTITKSLPYAYNWLLTAITGPDYVDRFPYGQVDENDWGYWVKMEYGKWTDKYTWRTPNEGGSKDIMSSTQVYTGGRKEIYYLDAIKTRSHTALFVKDLRRDAKGVTSIDGGGFNIIRDAGGNVTELPAASLKLNRILLYTNRMLAKQLALINNTPNVTSLGVSTLKELNAKGSTLQHTYPNNGFILHHGKNILDENDLNDATTNISNSAIRQYKFNYSEAYTLCQGTPNSFDINYNATSAQMVKTNQNSGKLTLRSIETVGYNNTSVIPATSFEYAFEDKVYNKNAMDVWGNYKSDYTINDYDRSRITQDATRESAKYKQAWSLNKIHTPLGADIKIEYESDYYKNVVLANKKSFIIKDLRYLGGSDYEIDIYSAEPLSNLAEIKNTNTLPRISLLNKSKAIPGTNPNVTGRPRRGLSNPGGYYYMHLDNNLSFVPENIQFDETRNVIKFTSHDLEANYTSPYYAEGDGINESIHDYREWGFYTGNIVFDLNNAVDVPGGDIRVKSIAVSSDLKENITQYSYNNSGVTSYLPVDFNPMIDILETSIDPNVSNHYSNTVYGGISRDNIKSYKDRLYKLFYSDIVANTGFIPPPAVLYENVIVQDKVRHYDANNNYTEILGEGSVKYNFSVFNISMLPRQEGIINTLSDLSKQRTVNLVDSRNKVGLLINVISYAGRDATGQVLSELNNNYLHLNSSDYKNELKSRFANQGRIDQVFFEKKVLSSKDNLLITKIEEHPVIQTGTVYKDNKKGVSTDVKTLVYDFYSGSPVVSWTKNVWGEYISENVAAYHVYPQMGHKIIDSKNKHMLIQQTKANTYKVVPNKSNPVVYSDYNKVGLMSAAVQTWTTGLSVLKQDYATGVGIIYQNNVNDANGIVWRSGELYSWIGDDNVPLNSDGSYDLSHFSAFDFMNASNNGSKWQDNGYLALVDVYSHINEAHDMNNNSSTVIMDPTLQYITASASFAKKNEIAYSGAEFSEYYSSPNPSYNNKLWEGNVKIGAGSSIISDVNKAHTGEHSLLVPTNKEGFIYSFIPEHGKKYNASAWVYLPGTAEGAGNDLNTNARLVYRVKGTTTVLNKLGEGYRSTTRKARGFYLLNALVDPLSVRNADGTYPEIEVVCINDGADRSIYFDDFRVAPLESTFTSYVYDLDKGLLTHVLDADNFYTRFEYDAMGNLKATYQEIFREVEKKVTEQRINYSK